MEEIWKPIPEWEGLYEISNLGRVKSTCHRNHIIRKQRTDKDGYLIVTLKKIPRECTLKVHRGVVAAFVGPCPDDSEVNHKNGNRADNRLENLEYATKKQNQQHAWDNFRSRAVCTFSKITAEKARAIKEEYLRTRKLEATAKMFGMSKNAVWLIGTSKTWKNI